jgi:DNA-binding IclR family transcriptional regulator
MTKAEDDRRYKAPALEKGLDVLELLSRSERPLTINEIGRVLDRSHGELFRMIQVLVFRGYIEQVQGTDGYQLTDRLLALGLERPLMRSLVEVALPEMRQLAEYCGQSCHLAVRALGDIIVIARMESSQQLSFSLPVGYRQPMPKTASGAVLYAFQTEDVRRAWRDSFDPDIDADTLKTFETRAARTLKNGQEQSASRFVEGVSDISVPVFRAGSAVAALTIPYLKRLNARVSLEAAASALTEAAARISDRLIGADVRP